MNTLIKLLAVILVLNIFMYIGVNFAMSLDGIGSLNKNYNFHFEGDLIQSFMSGSQDLDQLAKDTKENWTNYGIGLNANFTNIPDKQGGVSTGTGGINFLDSLGIVYDFIITLGNLAIAPLTLFFNFNMPVFIGLMIGIPYFFIIVLCIFAFIRGAGD